MSQAHDFPFGIMDVIELLHLRIRRPSAKGVYVDCPFCNDKRGKMHVNRQNDTWRCNYCNESGGMLALYAALQHISNSEAYREICDAIQNGICFSGYSGNQTDTQNPEPAEESPLAEPLIIHNTLSALFSMLSLTKEHREHLRTKRGLTDEQIEALGYKSTAPFYLSRPLAEKLVEKGYQIQGVPGFYQKDGRWMIRFSTRTAGILIPVRGIDGLIRGCQIRLDVPLKNDDDDPDKDGAKYIWLSSAGKPKGTSSGSPLHFVGDPCAGVVYVTEGILKADVSHYLMNRTFAAMAGANNTAQLDPLFAFLAQNGTHTIIEAQDMDKYRNAMVSKGASKIYLLAKKHGMECRRLTWNPNYKGIDDWQLALKRQKKAKENRVTNFKQRFIYGLCAFDAIDDEVETWHEKAECEGELHEYLGLTEEEYALGIQSGYTELEKLLLSQRQEKSFRIYQLDFSDGAAKPFAFGGIKELHKANYEQPPAAEYRLVYDGTCICRKEDDDTAVLEQIFKRYSQCLPKDYTGRSLSPSDVVELYDDCGRRYFYRDDHSFCPVKFSPMLAKQ